MLLAADVGNTEIVLGVFRGSNSGTPGVCPRSPNAPRMNSRSRSRFPCPTRSVVRVPGHRARHRERGARRHRGDPRVGEAILPVRTGLRGSGRQDRRADPHRQSPRGGRRPRGQRAGGVHASRRSGDRASTSARRPTSTWSDEGEFVGGVIAPGMQASAASLFSRTARLTRVELSAPPSGGQEHGRGDPIGADLRDRGRGRRDRRRGSVPSSAGRPRSRRGARSHGHPALLHDRSPRALAHAPGPAPVFDTERGEGR